jgi:prepilin-type N-terminal cleavage/methylation domain-containing protein
MNDKKGFTLIELLAVIVILAIIALIATQLLANIIKKARMGAFENDIRAIIRTIEYQEVLDQDFNIFNINKDTVKTTLNMSNDNYEYVEVSLLDEDIYIKVIGKNEWKGLTGYGINKQMTVRDTDEFDAITCQVYDPGFRTDYTVASAVQDCINITNADEFMNIKNDLDGKYCIQNNIDLQNVNNWEIIAPNGDQPFTGEIYGNNFHIQNLNVNHDGNFSLFGYIENAKFHDLRFSNMNINGNDSISLIAYHASGDLDIINSKIEDNNRFTTNNPDALITGFVTLKYGEGNLNIINSYANVNIYNAYYASPFIGMIAPETTTTIENSTAISNSKNIEGYSTSFGGFVALNEGPISIINSKANIKTENVTGYSGGFAGMSWADTYIENSMSTCDIDGSKYAGCFIGFVDDLEVNNSVVLKSKITDINDYYGGMVGAVREFNLTSSCVKNSTMRGLQNSLGGGFAGIVFANINSDKIKTFGLNMSGGRIGGIFGDAHANTNMILHHTEYIKMHNANEKVGSMISAIYGDLTLNKARLNNISFNNINSDVGSIAVSTYGNTNFNNISVNMVDYDNVNSNVGGLVGSTFGNFILENAKIYNVNFDNTQSHIGGVIGANYSSVTSFNDTTITGAIKASNDNIGGIIGYDVGSFSTITDTKVNVNMSGRSYIGGLVGFCTSDTNLINIEFIGNIAGETPNDHFDGGIGGMYGMHVSTLSGNGAKTSAFITAGENVGGIVGVKTERSSITNIDNFTFNGNINSGGTYVNNKVGLYLEDF